MSFGYPAFFWAMLALIPLAAVYFIRVRPRRQPVNAFFLWEKIFQAKPANSLFQKLRNLLSLLIIALAFIASVLALTRPRFDSGETPDLLIIIDRSASMQAVDDGKPRMEEAKETAKSWITALSGAQRAAIASVAGKLEYHANLTTRARRLNDALDEFVASDLALNPDALRELSILASTSNAKILFVTDNHSPKLDIPKGIEVVKVGNDAGNVGIVAADLRWTSPRKATLFTTLSSTFDKDKLCEVEVISPGENAVMVRLFTMMVPANGQLSESIEIDAIDPGQWLLRVDVEDSLAQDNVAPLGLNPPQAIPVQVIAEQTYFFDQVIQAFARADSLFVPTTEDARLSLSQGSVADTPVAVVFAPTTTSRFWNELGAQLPPGPPEILSPDHPLLARVDPTLLTFEGARKLKAPEGSVVVLAHQDGTPLLYTISKEGKAAAVFNFDPSLNDFFLSPWFPVFVHDAVVLLTGRQNSFPSTIATGSTLEIPGTGTDGKAEFQSGSNSTPIAFESPAKIDRIGSYRFTRDSDSWNLGGALLSPGESGSAMTLEQPESFKPASGWSLATWLLLAAVLVILAEELLYHRRKIG